MRDIAGLPGGYLIVMAAGNNITRLPGGYLIVINSRY